MLNSDFKPYSFILPNFFSSNSPVEYRHFLSRPGSRLPLSFANSVAIVRVTADRYSIRQLHTATRSHYGNGDRVCVVYFLFVIVTCSRSGPFSSRKMFSTRQYYIIIIFRLRCTTGGQTMIILLIMMYLQTLESSIFHHIINSEY